MRKNPEKGLCIVIECLERVGGHKEEMKISVNGSLGPMEKRQGRKMAVESELLSAGIKNNH